MFRKLKSMMLLTVCSALGSAQVQSSGQNAGQILGGSLNSPIRLEVFSDFQCPACRTLYLETIRQVIQEYASKDKVCVIYHEYPLEAIHHYSREAARYSEAASRLGQQKLLPVFDSLFTDQAQWSQDGSLEATVAKALSRDDFQKLKVIMQDSSINAAIDKEVQLALQKEVKSTPTLFIYYVGKQQKVEGIVTYVVLKQFIDSIVR
jgi:protein-disulfide isomerase